MTYQQFRKSLAEEITRRSGEQIQVSFHDTHGGNDRRAEAITIGGGYGKLLPSMDVQMLYEEYGKGVSIRHLARLILHQYEELQKKYSIPVDFMSDYGQVSRHVFCKLVNHEGNEQYLQELPHETWEDLAVIVYYRMDPSMVDGGTITIRSEHLQRWGVSSDQLFQDAWTNTARHMHPVLRRLTHLLDEMEGREEGKADRRSQSVMLIPDRMEDEAIDGINVLPAADDETAELIRMDPEEIRSKDGTHCPLFILTNQEKCFGAITIAIPGEAERVAEAMHGDYYVLPSSIHECLILPDDGTYDTGYLDELVTTVNRTQLDPADVLSGHTYHYSCLEGRFDR